MENYMTDDLSDGVHPNAWWRDPDPESAHHKYLRMHSSDTNRIKITITERLLTQYDWSDKKVLEYGCGGGYFTIWMAKRGAKVQAIELNPNVVGAANFYAQKEGVADRVTIVVGDAESDTIEGQYDFVFAKDLIEHLEDDRPFFRRLGEQLKPGGRTYIATQNNHSLNYLIEGSYERFYRRNTKWFGWDKTHHRFYNASLLAQRFREVGIAVEHWGSSYLFPWRFLTKRLTGKPRPWSGWTTIDRALGMKKPFAKWGWSIMVIGRKQERVF
ncbi:MAG: class I SAM-dependent methyltransferase [Candidatus Binatia bacterium]